MIRAVVAQEMDRNCEGAACFGWGSSWHCPRQPFTEIGHDGIFAHVLLLAVRRIVRPGETERSTSYPVSAGALPRFDAGQ